MSGIQRFILNTGTQFGAAMLSTLATFLFTVYAASALGTELFGRFSVVQIFISSFVILIDLGLTNVIVREVSKKRGQLFAITSNILLLKAFLGILTFLLILVSGFLIGYEFETQQLIIIYALSVIPISVTSACVAIFNGHERMIYSTFSSIFNVLGSMGGIIALSLGYGLHVVFGIFVFTSLLATAMSLLALYIKFSKFGFQIDLSLWRNYISEAIPFGLIGIISMVGMYAGPLMLSKIRGEEAVGYYNIASKILNIIYRFMEAYNAAVYPLFNRLKSTSLINFNLSYKLNFKVMMVAGLGFVAIFTTISNKIIGFAFPAYEHAIPILQLLCWFSFFSLMAIVTNNFLYAEGKEKEVVQIMLLATVVSLISNILLINRFGTLGLSVGLIIFSGVQFLLSYIRIEQIHHLNVRKIAGQALIVALPVALAGILLNNLNLFPLLMIMSVIFISTLIITKVFDAEEIELLMGLPFLYNLIQLSRPRKPSE